LKLDSIADCDINNNGIAIIKITNIENKYSIEIKPLSSMFLD
jgi:hypothetical protein